MQPAPRNGAWKKTMLSTLPISEIAEYISEEEPVFLSFIRLNTGRRANFEVHEFSNQKLDSLKRTLLDPIRRQSSTGEDSIEVPWGKGWVKGTIGGKQATFSFGDEDGQLAVLVVCLHSRPSKTLWEGLHAHAATPLPPMPEKPPRAPWAALREDVSAQLVPDWVLETAEQIAVALAVAP